MNKMPDVAKKNVTTENSNMKIDIRFLLFLICQVFKKFSS